MHDYVVYCYVLPAGSPHMYALGISVPAFIGTTNMYNYDNQADLLQSLGRMGLTQSQQNQILTALASGGMYVLSGVGIPDAVATSFGIELHDGSMPNESNQIDFTACNPSGTPLSVNVLLNGQIMPAPAIGCFPWTSVATCLQNAGAFTSTQLDSFQQTLAASGTAQGSWRGNGQTVADCLS